jgi:hypothetical protein
VNEINTKKLFQIQNHPLKMVVLLLWANIKVLGFSSNWKLLEKNMISK